MVLGVAWSPPYTHRALRVPEGAVDSTPGVSTTSFLLDPPSRLLNFVKGGGNVLVGVAIASHVIGGKAGM